MVVGVFGGLARPGQTRVKRPRSCLSSSARVLSEDGYRTEDDARVSDGKILIIDFDTQRL